ncbi:MAG: hypothetical protein WCT14_06565 [Treponemataceae bacterium]
MDEKRNKGKKVRKLASICVQVMSVLALGACAPEPIGASVLRSGSTESSSAPSSDSRGDLATLSARLDSLAERERSTGFLLGLGLAESSLREQTGDYSGATIAAFKELLYARSLGAIDEKQTKERLAAVVAAFSLRADEGAKNAIAASKAAEAFLSGRWKEARVALEGLFPAENETDSFPRWMMLVCRMEEVPSDRATANAYAAIRTRYERFPEYWYRLARRGAADAAERCVALASSGTFAAESRRIMATEAGLAPSDGAKLLCRAEIEASAREVAASLDAKKLETLYPILTLPENPYTLYALGVLKGLAANDTLKTALAEAGKSKGGRLGERLRYAAGR